MSVFGRGSPRTVVAAPLSPEKLAAFLEDVNRFEETLSSTSAQKYIPPAEKSPFDPPRQMTRHDKLAAFKALPQRDALPNGNLSNDTSCYVIPRYQVMRSCVYITLRHFQFAASPPPLICLVINPHSKLVHACFPISKMGTYCEQIYPKIAEFIYESFLELEVAAETKYRPQTFMVDDPLLASFLQAELSNTRTKVKIVYQESQMIPTILSEKDNKLSQICNDLFAEIRKVTHSFIRDNALKGKWKCPLGGGEETDADCEILKACARCGILQPQMKRCSGCPHLQVNYCSSQCHLEGWKKGHKEECREKCWTGVTLL